MTAPNDSHGDALHPRQAAAGARRRSRDADQRHAAAPLDLTEPAWVVCYGPGSHRFSALATWPAPHPLTVAAAEAAEPRALMRQAELTYATHLATGARP